MTKREILNESKTRLLLFEGGIEIDESLPKHEEYYEKDNYMDAINTLDSIL